MRWLHWNGSIAQTRDDASKGKMIPCNQAPLFNSCKVSLLRHLVVLLVLLSLTSSLHAQEVSNNQQLDTDPTSTGPDAQGFFKRLVHAYKEDWNGVNDENESPRRIPPAPLSSPPFPSADWNYGGSSVIGAPALTS